MKKPYSSNKLKKARKIIKFWVKVLFTTDLMNEKSDRIDLIDALQVLKEHSKIKSGP